MSTAGGLSNCAPGVSVNAGVQALMAVARRNLLSTAQGLVMVGSRHRVRLHTLTRAEKRKLFGTNFLDKY